MKYLLPLLLVSTLLSAKNGAYLELGTEYIFSEEIELDNGTKYKFETPSSYILNAGYEVNQWSLEAEGVYTNTKFTDGKKEEIIKQTALANLYYNAYNETKYVSFIGGGAGVSKISIAEVEADGMPLVYHFTLGMGYMFSDHLALNLKYRYLKTDSYIVSGIEYREATDNIISTALKFRF